MAYLPDCQTREIDAFKGPILTRDAYGVPPENALLARNVEYISGGEMKTRFGHSAVWNPNEVISAMANWLYTFAGNLISQLVYFNPGVGVRMASLAAPASGTIMAQSTASGAVFAPAGNRLYAAFYKGSGMPDGGGQVYGVVSGIADPLFKRPPLTTEMTITTLEGAANSGHIVAGAHLLGFYLTTSNGCTTRLGPIDAGLNYKPITFTASGNRTVTVTFTPGGGYTWPTGAVLTIVMTTTTNLGKHIAVPGGTINVAGGIAYNAQIDITDEDLAQAGTDVTLQRTIFSQSAAGAAPFEISYLFPYASRMAYVGLDPASVPVCYFSEPSSFQSLTAAQHGVYLPGNLPIRCGFSMRGVAYLLGPHWTFSTSDNGGVPATWADPQLVDGAIGALGPYCIWLSQSQGFAWVADQGGLYLFTGGQFPPRPVSFYQTTDWQRINWAAATSVFVIDDKDRSRVSVYAPLDGATTPTHRLRFYYIDGTDPDSIKYSLDDISGYNIGAATLAEDYATKQLDEYIGPSSAGSVLRQNLGKEAHPYRDVSAGISSVYRTGLLPGLGVARGTLHFHHGDQIRVVGNGHLAMTVYSLDNVRNLVPKKSPYLLSATPGKEPLFRYSTMSEAVALEISNVLETDSWFWLTRLQHYYTLGPLQR